MLSDAIKAFRIGRQRWSLRGVGTAAALFRRGSRGLSTASQFDLSAGSRELDAPFFDLTTLPISEVRNGQDRHARSDRP
jgi:hypothetical protein